MVSCFMRLVLARMSHQRTLCVFCWNDLLKSSTEYNCYVCMYSIFEHVFDTFRNGVPVSCLKIKRIWSPCFTWDFNIVFSAKHDSTLASRQTQPCGPCHMSHSLRQVKLIRKGFSGKQISAHPEASSIPPGDSQPLTQLCSWKFPGIEAFLFQNWVVYFGWIWHWSLFYTNSESPKRS